MKRIRARLLAGMEVEQLWDTLVGEFILVFDDGELQVDDKTTLYSAYAWDFHRQYPATPLLKKHHVKTVLKGERLGSGTHLQLLGNVMWSVYDHYILNALPLYTKEVLHTRPNGVVIVQDPAIPQATEAQFRDYLAQLIYRTTNRMYNELSYRLSEYVVSLDVTDFVEVLRHPKLFEANSTLPERHAAAKSGPQREQVLDDTYDVARKVLLDPAELPYNPIALAARSKLVNLEQVLQCVSARGNMTDTDSNMFREPILRGYAQGFRKFYDSLVESRSAAKSLIFSKTPLQQAEYFSRRLQLMSQVVQTLHPGDCGSTQYLYWKVRPAVSEFGRMTFPGDLKQLIGKHYLDNDGTLKTVRHGDDHLIGKTLKLRSPMHCACADPYGICATCFGELSLSVPEGTNIGQMCCTSLAQKSSQMVLSVKHLDGSSKIEPIMLDMDSRNYLKLGGDENSYMLADNLSNTPVKLVIDAPHAANITDVKEVADVENLQVARVSELDQIGLQIGEGPEARELTLDVSVNRRLASLTMPMLKYIRKHGWEINKDGNYVIDMKDWDWSEKILTLPLRHFNMSDHSQNIATMLESSVDKMQERDTNISPDAVLMELFDLVNSKLSVNLAVLEVVLYATMIVSAEKGNYELPKPWTTRKLGVHKLTMNHRSLSVTMAYENHREVIFSPLSFLERNRLDHPLDGVLMPAEVFAQGPYAQPNYYEVPPTPPTQGA